MFKDRLNLIDKQLLSGLLNREGYVAKKFNSTIDQAGNLHLQGEICAPAGIKIEKSFLDFISEQYCFDCLNSLTSKEFLLPHQALVSILRINSSLKKYNKEIQDLSSDYDILTDLQHSLLSYRLYIEFHQSDYLNSIYLYPLYEEYENLALELEGKIKSAFKNQKEKLREIVTDSFFKEYQPGLWDFEKKFPAKVLASPLERLNHQLAQEFYYFWVDQNFSDNEVDVVNHFLQHRLTESKLEIYQISDRLALRQGLLLLIRNWVKEYKTLTSSTTTTRVALNVDLSLTDSTLVQSIILAFSFYSEKDKFLLDLPKLIALWLREFYLSDPTLQVSRFSFNIPAHHKESEVIEGLKLWDPTGSGPLKDIESAIISAKLLSVL